MTILTNSGSGTLALCCERGHQQIGCLASREASRVNASIPWQSMKAGQLWYALMKRLGASVSAMGLSVRHPGTMGSHNEMCNLFYGIAASRMANSGESIPSHNIIRIE